MTNTAPAPKKKKRLSMHQKQSLAGWAFLTPATLLIFIMSFYPMFSALLTSFKRGKPTALVWSEPLWRNYQFMLKDKVFIQSVTNTLTYLIIQVPIMLILAVIFASLLNNRDLKFRGLFRTCIFLPCATGLVAYSMIFRTLFTYDGMVNNMLLKFGLISEAINWLNDPVYAKAVIIIGLVWRWTGYNMVFYLSAMQSIDYSIYEAARIDGANSYQQLMRITIPLLRPIILGDGDHVHQRHAPALRRIRQPDARRAGQHDDHHVALYLQHHVHQEPELRLRRRDVLRHFGHGRGAGCNPNESG